MSPYGAPEKELYDYIPDFGPLFERYGDWIAHKYGQLLDHLDYGGDVVVVHPDEGRAGQLVRSLQLRVEQRLVAVAIPRRVLTDVGEQTVAPYDVFQQASSAAEIGHDLADWQRQLLQLRSQHGLALVLGMDEFNASGRSARAMVDLLHAFGVQVGAYLPFLDRHPTGPVPDVATQALYEIESPRAA
jgi:hypothetical protein